MKYTILGEKVSNSTEFDRRFKEVTGFSVEEFSNTKDKAKSDGHKYTEIKGKYQYICNSIYSTDLVYVKTLGDYMPKMPKLLSKPLKDYKAGRVVIVIYGVFVLFIVPAPMWLMLALISFLRKDMSLFTNYGDKICENITEIAFFWKESEY